MIWTLVTGGARRLGAEICRTLASEAHSLVIHYNHSSEEAEQVAKECRSFGVEAETIHGDFASKVTTESFINKYLEQFPNTKNLINNVGNYFIGPASKTSTDQWYDLFQNNLHTPFILINSLIPSLKKYKGNIINIG